MPSARGRFASPASPLATWLPYKYILVYTSELEVRNYPGSMISLIWLFAMSIVKTRQIE